MNKRVKYELKITIEILTYRMCKMKIKFNF